MPLRTRLALLTAGLTAATCLTAAGPAQARTSPASHACSPSVSIDRFFDALDKTTYEDTFVGNISALAVDSDGSLAALSDRSLGNTVRLYLADPGHALRKTLLTDLATCPTLGATAKQPQPNPLLDNIEAMTITGRTKNALKVLLASDDNQNPTQTTRFYYLRVRITPLS